MGVGGGWAKAVAPSPAPLCSINRLSNNQVQYYQMFMHLSMLSPRVGGGGADPGEFDIFMEARVKFPTPRHLMNVKFPPHQGPEKDS